jgi:hypothetical protein
VGAENSVTSCDLQVLVDETAESIWSQRSNSRFGARGSATFRRELTKRSVWTVGVLVLEVLLQHSREVAGSGDQ